MPVIDLTVQIVNYKTKKYLNSLLESVTKDLSNENRKYEIFILDNNSGDDLTSIKDQWESYNVQTFTADKNRGFGAGHNTLAQKATGRYLLILNPDTLLIEKHTISRLINSLKSQKATVVGPALIQLQDSNKDPIALDQINKLSYAPQLWDHGELVVQKELDESVFTQRNLLGQVAWVSGAVLLIERKSFEVASGFDEKFFLYKEEEDLCLRIRRNGGSIIYDPYVHVLHIGSVVATKDKYMDESINYYEAKHGNKDAV